MEFNISSAGLLKGILDVAKALPAKTTALPILENFLFVLKDGRLEITASDQELTLRTSIEVQGSTREGSIAVPARQMIAPTSRSRYAPAAAMRPKAPSNACGATEIHRFHISRPPTIQKSKAPPTTR